MNLVGVRQAEHLATTCMPVLLHCIKHWGLMLQVDTNVVIADTTDPSVTPNRSPPQWTAPPARWASLMTFRAQSVCLGRVAALQEQASTMIHPHFEVTSAHARSVPGVCNAYLPEDTTLNRFMWVVNYFAQQGFYLILDNQFNLDQTATQNTQLWLSRVS